MRLEAGIKLAFILGALIVAPVIGRSPEVGGGSFEMNLPLGIPFEIWSYYVPRDNPLTSAKVELGRRLFFDPLLSADGTVSCVSCHDPARGFADGRKVAEGVGGRKGARNSPSLLNSMFNSAQFWDGRAATLEQQATLPLTDPNEMGNSSLDEVVERVRSAPGYVEIFRKAFGGDVTIDGIARAIASFERTLISGDSAYDRFNAGDRDAMSEAARRGLALFLGKARCRVCHSVSQTFPFFSDQTFRNTGVAAKNPSFPTLARRAMLASRTREESSLLDDPLGPGLGRFRVTGNSLDIGAFRTPGLRDVELTAPYFHDGGAASLEEVVRFYTRGGVDNPGRDWELHPVHLDDSEMADLIEFLKSLTGSEAKRLSAGTH